MQKLSSLVYSEMICFFRSCRLLMLKQVRSTMVRFGWVPPSQPALPFWNDCLNFFSLSKYSSRAALPGTSPYTTKYFFLFVLCFRWYPCSTTFSAFGMISDEARPAPDPDTPALLLPVVVPGVADGVPDGVAFMPAIAAPSSGVPGWCWSLAGVEVADDDECIIFARANGRNSLALTSRTPRIPPTTPPPPPPPLPALAAVVGWLWLLLVLLLVLIQPKLTIDPGSMSLGQDNN
uniref:Uncharacterized protein n=1 Tax=Anopheles melas TaxID=34690 RepID=A0A182U8F3_9DIPT